MAQNQARALYMFDGDPANGELSFQENDLLYIIRQDVGDGWWEAKNSLGEFGLVPESYVEVISIPEPQIPPPPPPASALPSAPASNGYQGSDWGQNGGVANRSSYHAPTPQQQPSVDEWDDEWDDDDDQSSNSTGTNQVSNEDLQGSGNFGLGVARREKGLPASGDMSKYGTVKSSFNRFSQFAKSGGEAFLMGQVTAQASESDLIRIIETPEGPCWQNNHSPYTCVVSSPKKESKMKGLKSFIIYQLTPSFSNLVVSRRYKHFDWLHERLVEKFPCIPIPPLPDKSISGRYEEDFIQERMRQLQLWINRMVSHPIVSQSEVFLHFLACTDDKKWKAGKRRAERDEYQGGKFFLLLQTPPVALTMREVEMKLESFCKFVMNFTENVKQMMNVINDLSKRESGGLKREYQKISASCKQMAMTFNMDDRPSSQELTGAMDYMGDAFRNIEELLGAQPRKDAQPLVEHLHEYKGILQTFPDVLKVHEGAMGKAKECRNLQEQGKMTEAEVQAVCQRGDVISFAILAEINHFQKCRIQDFKIMMDRFLEARRELLEEELRQIQQAQEVFQRV